MLAKHRRHQLVFDSENIDKTLPHYRMETLKTSEGIPENLFEFTQELSVVSEKNELVDPFLAELYASDLTSEEGFSLETEAEEPVIVVTTENIDPEFAMVSSQAAFALIEANSVSLQNWATVLSGFGQLFSCGVACLSHAHGVGSMVSHFHGNGLGLHGGLFPLEEARDEGSSDDWFSPHLSKEAQVPNRRLSSSWKDWHWLPRLGTPESITKVSDLFVPQYSLMPASEAFQLR